MKTKSLFAGIAVLTLIGQSEIHAQATWTGVGTSGTPALWSVGGVGGNWSGAAAPSSNSTISVLTFSNTTNSFSNNNLTGLTISGISMLSSLDNTITGNKFTLSGDVTVSTGSWQAINTDIGLTGNRKFIVSNGQLTLGGTLTDGASAGGILKEGVATLILKGASSMTGISTQTVAGGNPGAGSYTMPLVFNTGGAGTVVLQNTAALGTASLRGIQFNSGGGGTLDLQTDTSVNSYGIFAGSGGTANTIIANRLTSVANANITHNLGVAQLGSASLTINKGANVTGTGVAMVTFSAVSLTAGNNDRVVTLNGSAAISLGDVATTANAGNNRRLGLAGTNASNAVTGVISNLATGVTGTSVLSLIKSDSSTWTLTGANTYTGITTIAGGTLQLGNGGATGTLNFASAIQNGGTLAINRSGTITQGTDFAGTIGAYTIDYSTDSAGVLLGSAILGKLVKSGSGNLILNGSNTLAAADSLTFSGNGSGTATLTNTSALGAAGNSVRFSGSGSGTLDLQTNTSVNAYNITSGSGHGGTIIANRATSGASISHALGVLDLSSVTLTVNKGSNVTGTAAASFTELKMTGGNDNNPVTLAGSADISISSASITNNGIAKRLQLDGTSQSNTIGQILDSNNSTTGAKVNLIKANSSTWTFTSANTYTGDTTIKAGTLALGAAGTIANSPNIIVGDAGSSGAILDISAKTGFSVSSSQKLSGIGTVVANASGALKTLTINGTHAPGNGAGIQTVDGNLSYASNSIFEWELTANTATQGVSPNPTFDQVAIASSGTLSIASDAKFRIILNSSGSGVDFTQSFWSTNQSWSIFTGASALNGFTLDSVSADKNGVAFAVNRPNGSFSITGSTLTWSAVPEPGGALIGLLVGAGLLRRRRGC